MPGYFLAERYIMTKIDWEKIEKEFQKKEDFEIFKKAHNSLSLYLEIGKINEGYSVAEDAVQDDLDVSIVIRLYLRQSDKLKYLGYINIDPEWCEYNGEIEESEVWEKYPKLCSLADEISLCWISEEFEYRQ